MVNNKKSMVTVCMLMLACILMIPVSASAKTYYSMKQLGVSNYTGTPNYQVKKWKGNTIKYRKFDTSKGSDYPKTSKWKTAKITKSTKYYKGNVNRFYKVLDNYMDDEGRYSPRKVKFISKTSKSNFKKYYRKNSSFVWINMVIKKGKIKKIIYGAQVAG